MAVEKRVFLSIGNTRCSEANRALGQKLRKRRVLLYFQLLYKPVVVSIFKREKEKTKSDGSEPCNTFKTVKSASARYH